MKTGYNRDQLYKTYVNIYTEGVPNPNSMKFVLNAVLLPEDLAARDYPNAQSATNSPFVEEFFKFPFVDRVFIAKNFITVTKTAEADWIEINPIIRNFIKNYIEEGSVVFSDLESEHEDHDHSENDSEDIRQIKNLLEEYIKPAVEMDGGAITFSSFDPEKGLVKLNLQGSCSGCPSSTLTLKAGIENLLKRFMPDKVREVVAESL